MRKTLQHLPETVNFIRQQYKKKIDTAIILGTGLNEIASSVEPELIIPYEKIPHFQVSTSPSHKGRMIFGKMAGKRIAIMQGRLHCYEGYTPLETTFPIFTLKKIGVQNLIITNAAGSLNKNLQKGDLVIITDHINLTGKNPLIGENDINLGPRFPSMHDPYHKRFVEIAKNIALDNNIPAKTGVYAGLIGPNLETTAECKMLKLIGADMVGLSTVHEVIVGIYLQMKIMAISIITNLSNLLHKDRHLQNEIEKIAHNSQDRLRVLLENFLKSL
ncbi:MAG: purine-nucleoside phosphorylase [Candidatus Cloacimonadota bacterium]|nr:purine-nucleoside phosphorylase [Candidatus Cloacimonadota bacterium]